MDKVCKICYEKFTDTIHKKIQCNFCQNIACKKCVQNYLLTIREEPHCMFCKTAWSLDFWMDILTKNFIMKKLKEHRENVLLDREKSMIPEAIPIAEKFKLIKQYETERLEIQKKIYTLHMELNNHPYFENRTPEEEKKHYELKKYLALLHFEKDYRDDTIRNIRYFVYDRHHVEPTERKQFIRQCPADGCKGML